MDFEVVSEISSVQTIAIGPSIRDLKRLIKVYGSGHWRKKKGIGVVRLLDGSLHKAEIHWYEAHGIGKKEFKLKVPFLN